MRICFIAEGCYPYVVGGVSSWIHSMIQTFPDQEFILLTIIANRNLSGQFAYALPPNVTEVHELSLEDVEWESVNKHNKTRLKPEEFHALRSLMLNQDVLFYNSDNCARACFYRKKCVQASAAVSFSGKEIPGNRPVW